MMKTLSVIWVLFAFADGPYTLHDPHMGIRQQSTIPELPVDWKEVRKTPLYLGGKPAGMDRLLEQSRMLDRALIRMGAQGVSGDPHPLFCHLAFENIRYHVYLRHQKNIPARGGHADIDHAYWYSRRRPALIQEGAISPLEDVGLVGAGTPEGVAQQLATMWRNSPGHRKALFPKKQHHCCAMAQGPDGVWYGVAIASDGKVKKSPLGIQFETQPSGNARISAVYPGSPAARAGLGIDDEVLGVGDTLLDSKKTLRELIPPKGPFRLSIRRKGQSVPEMVLFEGD